MARESGDSFLLPMTLAEVSILLFFLLLFVAVSQIREVESEARRSAAEVEKLQNQMSKVKNLSESEIQKAIEGAKKEKKIERLQEKVSNLQREVSGLDSLIQIRERYSDDEFDELVREASRNINRQQKINRLTERLEEAQSALDSTQNVLGDYRAQSINLTRRLREAGQGYPPCWADEEGNPQYIYTVQLLGDSLVVRPNWPNSREGDLEEVDGASTLAGRKVSRGRFAELAGPVLEWSKRQDPECRHFVVIEDSERTTKEEFKDELLLVERFFYKYIER